MIFDATNLAPGTTLRADLCVIGSGAGGSMVAMVAAEAGMSVVVLEAGPFLTPEDFTQREEAMFPRLYWEAGGRTSADRRVKIHQGRGIGGSTLHNLNLCKRVHPSLLARWAAQRPLERLGPAEWAALYDEVEALLGVTEVPPGAWNRSNQLLAAGAESLGWAWRGLQHNRSGCVGSGFCEVGCAFDAKNNALKVLVPRAVAAGAEFFARAQAVRVRWGEEVEGVDAVAVDPVDGTAVHALTIDAPRVVLAGSATATPAILKRSRVPDPSETAGNSLRIHPAVVVAAEMAEPVHAWRGIPQTVECTQWLDLDRGDVDGPERTWIVPAFAHPVATSSLLPGMGADHRRWMERYPHLVALTGMIHDLSGGTVSPRGDLGLTIDYRVNDDDRRALARGVWACAELLFAAGAERVLVPTDPILVLERGASLDDLRTIDASRLDLTAVHPMASVPMGDNARTAAVDSDGRHHALPGLWIADGSLLPTSIGGPPQLSIYALGLHVGRAIVGTGR